MVEYDVCLMQEIRAPEGAVDIFVAHHEKTRQVFYSLGTSAACGSSCLASKSYLRSREASHSDVVCGRVSFVYIVSEGSHLALVSIHFPP